MNLTVDIALWPCSRRGWGNINAAVFFVVTYLGVIRYRRSHE